MFSHKEYYKKAHIDSYKSAIYQQKIVTSFINMLKLSSPKARVLDAGSGIGRNINTLQKFFPKVIATDVSLFVLEKSRKNCNNQTAYVVADVQHLPFKEQSFNIVVCTEVIEHVTRPELAINSIERVLKPGGHLIISSPNYSNLTGLIKWFKDKKSGSSSWSPWHAHDSGFERLMNWKQLRNLLHARFKILKSQGAGYIYAWLYFTPLRNYDSYYPFISLGKVPLLKRWGMNYYILSQKL